jgi:hypothetical protein
VSIRAVPARPSRDSKAGHHGTLAALVLVLAACSAAQGLPAASLTAIVTAALTLTPATPTATPVPAFRRPKDDEGTSVTIASAPAHRLAHARHDRDPVRPGAGFAGSSRPMTEAITRPPPRTSSTSRFPSVDTEQVVQLG